MIVMKVGGSSLRSTTSLLQVTDIIGQAAEPEKIVVLSAVSGVTDHLFKSAREALQTERRIRPLLDYLHELHRELILGAIQNSERRRHAMDEIDYLLSRLEKLLFGVAYTGECTQRTMDMIVSMGERMAVQLLAACLQDKGWEGLAMDADKIDLVAHGEFGYGNADLETTSRMLPHHLQDPLRRHAIPVITGFFGRTSDGHTITFGRGGTDYSAAIIAYAMDCQELQIWKDVDGFLTAAPDMVANAKPLEYLAYEEAAELSYFGASILHPRTVEPLAKKRIPAVIKNTYKPDVPGTVVGPDKHQHEEIIKSVVANKKIGAIRIHGASLGQQLGFLRLVVSSLSDNGINIISVITAQTAVNLLLDKKDIPVCEEILKNLHIPYIDHIETLFDVALVGVVGEGLAETRGLAARDFTSVAAAGTNVEMITSGASKAAQYFIIKENQLQQTVQAVHAEFFGKN